mgnify:CR=1 FL=1
MQYMANIDVDMLCKLGFTYEEVQMLYGLIEGGCKLTSASLSNMGLTYQEIKKLQYMYTIIIGKTIIDMNNIDKISKHFNKINSYLGKININNLPISKVGDIPRLLVVEGLPEGRYAKYNYSYENRNIIHILKNEGNKKVIIRTKIKPKLPYGSGKCLYYFKDKSNNKILYTEDRNEINKFIKDNKDNEFGVAVEIKGLSENKKEVDVAIHKNYVRLIRPYIILCSFTRPQNHLGMYQTVLYDGSKLYIYANYYDGKGRINNNSSSRVYYWGYKKKLLTEALLKVAKGIYNNLGGVFVEFIAGTTEYEPIEK